MTDNLRKSTGRPESISSDGSNMGGRPERDNPRRRRTGGTITSLACTECRRARAKCDGENQEKCTRCSTRGLLCTYEPHTKTQKDQLIIRLQQTRAREESALKSNRDYSIILDILTRHGHVDELVRRLKDGESVEVIVRWLSGNDEFASFFRPGASHALLGAVKRMEALFQQEDLQDIHVDNIRIRRDAGQGWTSVTSNFALIRHLFELYFVWVHANHMLFSEAAFMGDFNSENHGSGSSCSSSLVNAVCAMACNLLSIGTPADSSDVDVSDQIELQRAFMDEARKHLSKHNMKQHTSTQAFAVMFLVELSAGRGRTGTSYLRTAAERTSIESQGDSSAPSEISRWGIHTLTTAWCAFNFMKPYNPQPQGIHIILKLVETSDLGSWTSETGSMDRQNLAIRMSAANANLFRIVHRTITMYCGTKGHITGAEALARSREFITWRANLPQDLQLEENFELSAVLQGGDSRLGISFASLRIPLIISLHLQYFAATVGLFVPIVQFEHISEAYRSDMRNYALHQGRSGLGLIDRCPKEVRRRLLPITILAVLHLSDFVARYSSDFPEKEWAVDLCAHVLQENRHCFKLSGPLLQMFRSAMKEVDARLVRYVDNVFGAEEQYGMDDLLEAYNRLDYEQPIDQIKRLISHSFENEWADAVRHEALQPRSIPVERLLNQ